MEIFVGLFLVIIIIQLSIIIWLLSCNRNNNISTFFNTPYVRTIDDVQIAWKKTGCNEELNNIQIENLRKLNYYNFIKTITLMAAKCNKRKEITESPLLSLSYLLPEHKNELEAMWINGRCGKIRFPAQNLNRFYRKSYISSNNKNIVFEDIKNWLNGEIEDMCG